MGANNQPIKTWDANGNAITINYDVLRRPIETWLKDTDGNPLKRTQFVVYGEQLTTDQSNHRGQPYLNADGAGVVASFMLDICRQKK